MQQDVDAAGDDDPDPYVYNRGIVNHEWDPSTSWPIKDDREMDKSKTFDTSTSPCVIDLLYSDDDEIYARASKHGQLLASIDLTAEDL